jgi:hypothetical protein
LICLFEHTKIKKDADADLRILRIAERPLQQPGSTDVAYVRILRIKVKVSI